MFPFRMKSVLRSIRNLIGCGATIVCASVAILPIIGTATAGPAQDAALFDATGNLDVAGVEKALKAGGNPNAATNDENPRTPINTLSSAILAREPDAEDRALQIARLLFKHGAKVQSVDEGALYLPIASGHLRFVTELVIHGASLERPISGYRPAEIAIKYGHIEIYDFLLSKGAVPVAKIDADQLVFVQSMVEWDLDRVKWAKERGGYIDRPDTSGRTPLLAALDIPIYDPVQADIVEWLIANGANVNTVGQLVGSSLDYIPLHEFISSNSRTMNGQDKDVRKRSEQVMLRLIQAGAKIGARDELEATPLHRAASSDNLRAAEILIEEGAKIMARDFEGKTPLDYAESGPMIKLLKAHGATE